MSEPFTFGKFKQFLALANEQNMLMPNCAISLIQGKGFAEPHIRPQHWLEWPLPIYNNDNVF